MAELDTLLEAAKAAQPGDRIQWRDPISACGAEAIPAMTEWIRDAKLGAFAVTVLERIAADSAHRSHVIRTLQAANHDQLPAPVARDVADALNRIPGGTSRRPGGTGGKRSASSETWPGDR